MPSDARYYNAEDLPKIEILRCSPFTKRESAILHLLKKCREEIGENVDFYFCQFDQFKKKTKRLNDGELDVIYTKCSIPFEKINLWH
jgi:hypothetical protein